MNKAAVTTYTPLIHDLSRDYIRDLLNAGKQGQVAINPTETVLRTIVDLTMTVNYGKRLPKEPGVFEEVISVEEQVSLFRSVTGAAQDYIPLLRWNPINQKSARARATNARRLKYLNRFSDEHKQEMKDGTDKPCIQGNVLRDPDYKFTDIEMMSINMSMVSGGIDTLANTLIWTIGTLAQRPDVQAAAYDAIVEVYGTEDWDNVEHDNQVPYITALVRESLRFFTVLRMSLPRAAWRDIEYEGVFIPKGSTVFLNAWGCNRGMFPVFVIADANAVEDEGAFGPDVDEYRPERFLDESAPRLDHAAFGFGECFLAFEKHELI